MYFIASLVMLVFMILLVTVFGLLYYLTLQYVICPIFMWLGNHKTLCYVLGICIIVLALLQGFFYCYHLLSTVGG